MDDLISYDRIGATIDDHLGDGVFDLPIAEGRRRFIDYVAISPSPLPRMARQQALTIVSLVGAALVSVAALVLVVVDRGRMRQLEARRPELTPAFYDPGDDVIHLETSHDQSGATVQLVSGASVTLSRHTRGSSRSMGPKSYRVRLDYGQMTFTIAPHVGATWIVDVGSYQVRVIGTVFTIRREPADDTVEVRVQRGHVEISSADTGVGSPSGQTITLGPGSLLRATGNQFRIHESSDSVTVIRDTRL